MRPQAVSVALSLAALLWLVIGTVAWWFTGAPAWVLTGILIGGACLGAAAVVGVLDRLG